MRVGQRPDYLARANTAIVITDSGQARRTLSMSELVAQLAEPMPMAA